MNLSIDEGLGAQRRTVFVRDKLARTKDRVHDLPGGPAVTFKANGYVELPFDRASRLIGNDGFEVRTEPGGQGDLIDTHDFTSPLGGSIKIRSDQCVASYDELTIDALLARCANLPNADQLKKGTKKEVLISALVGGATSAGAGAAEEDDDESLLPDDDDLSPV